MAVTTPTRPRPAGAHASFGLRATVLGAIVVLFTVLLLTTRTALGVSEILLVAMPLAALAAAGALVVFKDAKDRDVLYQVLTFSLIAAGLAYLIFNTITNLETRKIATGYDFLDKEARFAIGEHMIDYSPASSYGRALLVGFLNTLKVAVIGVVLATALGISVGILLLSRNWLVTRVLGAYVSFMRNVPVLLHMVLWYSVITFTMPPLREALEPVPGVYVSQRGINMTVPADHPAWTGVLWAIPLALLAAWLFARYARAHQARTGQLLPVFWVGTALVLGLPFLVWLVLGAPTAMSVPEIKGFNFQGGYELSPEFIAILVSLVIYTSAYIAEITRSGILAVPHGQTEAGRSLGLSDGTVMRQVILPQALRVIIPPMTNQFLNLTKNSSLAVQIGYPDLVSIGNTTLNQTGQAIEVISIIMIVYLTTSLATSLLMNWYNRRIQLVER